MEKNRFPLEFWELQIFYCIQECLPENMAQGRLMLLTEYFIKLLTSWVTWTRLIESH